jgi:hypothetical protein
MKQKNGEFMKFKWKWLIFLGLTILLTINIFKNPLGIANTEWFNNFETDSDALIYGKTLVTRTNLFSPNSFFLSFSRLDAVTSEVNSIIYGSQMGLHGVLFTIVSMILFWVDLTALMSVYAFLSSLFLSIILTMIIFWVYKEFGLFASAITFVTTFANPWLIVVGNSPYWAIWANFLPFIILLYFLKKHEETGIYDTKKINILIFLTVFFKAGSGYEFISVVLVMTVLPMIYYAYKNKWVFKDFSKKFLTISSMALLGFIVAVIVHLTLLTLLYDLDYSFYVLGSTIAKRTGMGDTSQITHEALVNSLNVPLKNVLEEYAITGIEERPIFKLLGKNIYMKHFIYLLGFSTVISLIDRSISRTIEENRRKIVGLNLIALISLLGPLSWLVFAKAHCEIHIHINYIIWSMPSMILIFSAAGFIFYAFIRDIIMRFSKKN